MSIRHFFPLCFILSIVQLAAQQNPDWEYVPLPPGGYPNDITFHDGKIFLAGGNLYYSDDEAHSWKSAWNAGSGISFTSVQTSRTGILLAGGSPVMASSSIPRLWKSTNDGQDWTAIQSFPQEPVEGIHIDSANIWYVTTYSNSIYRSVDEGTTWERLSAATTNRAFTIFPDNSLLTRTQGGMKRSTDRGETWQSVTFDGEEIPTYLLIETVHPDQQISISISTNNRLARTTNGGRDWHIIMELPDSVDFSIVGITAEGRLLAMSYDYLLYGSDDQGASWNYINSDYQHVTFKFQGLPNGTTMALGIGGPYVSADNGTSWHNSAEGIPALRITAACVRNGNELILATQEHGVIGTIDGGVSWRSYLSGAGVVFLQTLQNGRVIGMNYGETWTMEPGDTEFHRRATLPFYIHNLEQWKSFAVVEREGESDLLAISTTPGVIRLSEDFGATWKDVFIDSISFPTSVGLDAGGNVYATVKNKLLRAGIDDVLHSATPQWETLLETKVNLFALTVGSWFIACGGIDSVWLSTDNGMAWQGVKVQSQYNGRQITVDRDTSIYLTASLSANSNTLIWKNSAEPNWRTSKVLPGGGGPFTGAVFTTDGAVYTGLNTGGLYRLQTPSVVEEEPVTGISSLALLPNPLTEGGTLRFECPRAGYYIIAITDLFGKRVWGEGPFYLEAGNRIFPLDLSPLPSGCYRCEVLSTAGGKGTSIPIWIVR